MQSPLPRWRPVRVTGQSMTPTLLSGDVIAVRFARGAGPGIHVGDVVVARFLSRPDLVVVKRVADRVTEGWWLSSDNPGAGSDSRQYGAAEVLGVARWVWPRGPGRVGATSRRGRLRRHLPVRLSRQAPIG